MCILFPPLLFFQFPPLSLSLYNILSVVPPSIILFRSILRGSRKIVGEPSASCGISGLGLFGAMAR